MPHWLNSLSTSFHQWLVHHGPSKSLSHYDNTTFQPSSDNPDELSFQITVSQLTCSSPPPKGDVYVTICINDVSKMTCVGKLSDNDSLAVTWNHPFLFTASLSSVVVVEIWTLPKKITARWNRQQIGDQMVIDVGTLLRSRGRWKCNVPGICYGSQTLSMTCMASNVLIPPDKHDCALGLWKYACKLYKQPQVQQVSLSTQVALWQAALDFYPEGCMEYNTLLQNLIASFIAHFKLEGSITDLNRAIELCQVVFQFCPPGHPGHTKVLGELAFSISEHYLIHGNETDLHMIIDMADERLCLCPLGHPEHTRALGDLATFLWYCFNIEEDMTDLNKAMEMEQRRLDLCPVGHLQHLDALGNIAMFFSSKYFRYGDLADLNKAIELEEKKLALCPSKHPQHALALQNLACSLVHHYSVLKTPSDLIWAIRLYKEVLTIYPAQHRLFSKCVQLLAEAILLHHSTPQDAFEQYRQLKACAPAVSVDLWLASQAWAQDAEKHNHPSALEAYQTALNTLDHLTCMQSSLGSRHETMQARLTDLANNAFSCAVRHTNLPMAAELLEQGRGILWNQLARVDVSVVALESQGKLGKELGIRFTQLSASLRKHAGGSGEGMYPYWRVKEEWQSVVDNIRRQDGFSRFLLPPSFDDLRRAAECGPVIIVNASEYTCDALIILHTRPPIHVPLDCSLDVYVTQVSLQFSQLVQDPSLHGEQRQTWVKQLLRGLWSIVVQPIVIALQNDVQLPLGSRIWWCPASKFTTLPLHAAGPYRKDKKNLMDLYISSYTPSLSALIRARDHARSQKKARGTSRTAKKISFAAIAQSRPSPDQGLHELKQVEREIYRIQHETGMPQRVSFKTITDYAATIEGAIQAFRDHRWVHLACHGEQVASLPFESSFGMGDGPLTLMRIIQERYTNSEFAFLSACHTAVGDMAVPDEVLHLAAGMHFAGFNGVVGTLWEVSDSMSHELVTRFYREMFKHPVISSERAAEALNIAVVESAQEVPLEKRIVFVHIGI